ncbi:MAG: histidinol-phosphate transaminase [Candidatus Marinimicrobia bacterium]|nr:histidinol-phosphate transaminase [Candidatus Neomarinimicrobiota bacterium]MCF7827582.1 histidinol-phosphate transaminase [Candidatus Neomarinimicrobiota bacterium]MCF7881556.1 histidinol-phosphate transaminase [Candidatus Neomarinimicrobiota bacterium]
MSNPLEYLKESVRNKKIYTLPDIDYDIKANQNENPYDLPESVKSEILQGIESTDWNRYPRLGSGGLREKIGQSMGLPAGQVMVGNGSNEIILAVMNALLQPGKQLVIAEPTFSLYRHYGEISGARVEAVRLKEDFAFPADEITDKSQQPDTALTVLCSPNNPTGSTIGETELREILNTAPGFVLIDEAYIDFCSQDFCPLLDDYSNLIITRTFSKAFAFALGRFGYGVAAPDLVNEIYKVLMPYNLNGFSEIAAGILLQHRTDMETTINRIVRERERLIGRLSELDSLDVYPSEANFFLIKPEIPSDELYEQLIGEKILIRDVSHYPGLDNYLRISTGTPKENDNMFTAIANILG